MLRTQINPGRALLAAALIAFTLLPGAAQADAVLDVVITEIMYNPSSGDRRDDFIELYNMSATESYNLEGWFFEDGVDFVFPPVILGPQKYLVVCADEDRVRQAYGITNTIGNWNPLTTLDNGGERIRLVYPGLTYPGDPKDLVEVEDITFDDRNPWPILADGYGHSLEKRKILWDNDDPANWAASSVGQSWIHVSVSGLATSSRLYVYLDAAGIAYVDDVKIYPVTNPGDDHIVNGGFESGLNPWDPNGTHSGSTVTTEKARTGARSLKIVATGAGQSSGDSVMQDNLGLIDDNAYTLEFWVFLTEPGQRIIARLSGATDPQAEDPIYIESGGGGATPGRENSVNTDDLPPFIYPVLTEPEAPVNNQTVTLLAVVADDGNEEELTVTAHWDAGSGEQSLEMFDDGAHNDGGAADGIYGAALGAFPTGTIVYYYVTAEDDTGQPGRYPFFGNPTQMLGFFIESPNFAPDFDMVSNTGLTSDKPAVYHFRLDPGQLTIQNNWYKLSSSPTTYRRGTFIYNGEVFENVRIRHRGQSSLGSWISKWHWKVDFNKDHRFLTPFANHPEIDNFNLQSCFGDKSYLREWLSYKAWLDIGEPGLECWHVRLYINGRYQGLYVHMENADEHWMNRSGLDDEGWLWKSYSQAQSGSTGGFEPEEMAGRQAEAFSALGSFLSNMNSLSGTSLVNYINNNMDVPGFINFLAIHQLIHNADHPAKNYFVYADEDSPAGTWVYLGWDMDLTHGRNFECSGTPRGGGVYNDWMRWDFWGDTKLLLGTQVKPKCDGPWNGVINAFLWRTDAFRQDFYDRTAELLIELYHPDVLLPIIDDMAAPLAAEVAKEWSEVGVFHYGATPNTYQFHVNDLKGWAENRYDYLINALTNLTAPDVSQLTCTRVGNDVTINWTNNASYDAIKVHRNQVLLATLGGTVDTYPASLDPGETVNTFRVASVYQGVERPGQSCTIIVSSGDYATVINETFSPPASSAELSVNCNAQQVNGVLQLTPPSGTQAGTAFFRTKFSNKDFIADFDLRFDEPSSPGADGMIFAMIRGNNPAICGSAGGALGFWAADAGGVVMEGFGVVFDTWENTGEPSHNWVGFIDTDLNTTGAVRAVDLSQFEFNGNGTFHVRVLGSNGTVTVIMENEGIGMAEQEIFTHNIPGYIEEDLYFGFTAGTGGAWARHIVDNFVLQVKSDSPPPVVAAFHAQDNRTTGEVPFTVTFVNDSTGATSYNWDFGDGETSTAASPPHTYNEPGIYTVKLTATGEGGSDVETKANYINATVSLEVAFTADKTVGSKPLTVQFTNQSSSNVTILSYSWDFGDGGGSALKNPSHTYIEGGAFTVSLTVIIQGGLQETLDKPNYIRIDDELEADFSATPLAGESPLEVQFTDTSQGTTIQSWTWNFGDGETSTEQNPKHTYTDPGLYDVSLLIVGHKTVRSAEKLEYITVIPPGEGGIFIRGDFNGDLAIDISDAVGILAFLFIGGTTTNCEDSGDFNDDGELNVTDITSKLGYLFLSGIAPMPPFPNAGKDTSPDFLTECTRGL